MRSRLFAFLLLAAPAALAQEPAQPAPAAPAVSSVLSPALNQIGTALAGLRLSKWKAPGSVRQETDANVASISRDLDGTLPPLLAAADAAPGAATQILPVFRNIDALYDVLLRVTAAADHGAPRDQQASLGNALTSLETARHNLGDVLEQAIQTQDTAMQALKTQLGTPPPAPACPETHPVHRPVRKRHPQEHPVAGDTPQQ